MIRAADQEGNAVTTTRDLSGKPRQVTDPKGNPSFTVYYGAEREGRVKQRIDALGRVTTFDYDANGNVIRVTDPLGRTTLTTYDELNRPTRVAGPVYTDPTYGTIRPVTVTTYDTLGRVASVAAGRTDSSGTNPASDNVTTQMAYVYDDFGRKLRETDALSRTWQWVYTTTNGAITQIAVTDPKGQATTATYGYGLQLMSRTAAGAPGSALVALNRSVRTATDGYAPLYRGGICVTNDVGACTGGDARLAPGIGAQLGYTKTTSGAGTVAVYPAACYSNPAGNCTTNSLSLDVNGSPLGYLSTTDPNNPASTPFMQSGGLLLQGLSGTPSAYLWTSPAGASKTDPVLTTGMVPDGYTEEATTGYLLQSSGTGTRALERYVNSTGSHFYTTDTLNDPPVGYALDTTLGYLEADATNGGVILYRYANTTTGDYLLDTSPISPSGYGAGLNLGYIRVVGAPPTGIVTTYTRNALGQVLQASNPNVTYTYTYDAAHRLQSVTDSRGPKRLTYTYSPGGRRTSMTDTDGGRNDYVYDPVGRLIGIWAPTGDLVSFAYDAGGRLLEKTFPNGVNTRYTYNPDNTLARVINRVGFSDANVISQHDYTYDGVGNRITHRERIGPSTIANTYTYDPLDRLTQAVGATPESYTYDPLGNRLTKTSGATTTYYRYDAANQLTQTCSDAACTTVTGTFSYDFNGNMIQRTDGPTTTMVYDMENRLAWLSVAGQLEQSYAYDDQDRRVRKTVGNATTQYLYDGPDIIGEYATWEKPTARTTHGPNTDDPLLRTMVTTQYFHQDGLGSVVALSNQSGATDGAVRYDAWGNRTVVSGAVPPVYGYTGREPDETGLVFYRARFYDPTLGRFTQRDPIGFAGGDINLYAYVLNNPINYADPSGELLQVLIGAGIGGLAGGVAALVSGRPVLAGIGIGAVTGAAVTLVGPAAAAVVGAVGNVAGQLASGTTDINLTAVAISAAAPVAGKFISGALGAAISGPGVSAEVARPLAQVTTGLALAPSVAGIGAVVSQTAPVRLSSLPSLPAIDPSFLPYPPPNLPSQNLQSIGASSGVTARGLTSDILRERLSGDLGPITYTGGLPGQTSAAPAAEILRDNAPGGANYKA